MYHRRLRIVVFSEDMSLSAAMQDVAPMETFEHTFRTSAVFCPDVVRDGDIVVLDLPWDTSLQALKALAGKKNKIILCAQQRELSASPCVYHQAVDDIWEKPFSNERIVFRFKQLLALLKLESDLRLHQIYLDTAIDSIPDLVWFKDVRGAHLKVNDGFCHAVGKSKKDIEGRGHYYIWDLKKEEYEQGEYVCLETEAAVLEARKTCLFDEMVKSKQGMRQFKTYKSPLFDDDGEIIGTVGIAHDVTDLRNMDAELEIILRSMPFSILISDNEGRVIKANARFERYFRIDKKDIVGMSYNLWKNSILKYADTTKRDGYEEVKVCFNDITKILEIHEEPILDIFSNVVGRLCVFRDVTIERVYEQQMLLNANTDALTGLYNRRFFHEYLAKNRGTNQISLLYIDLDNFKKVNDVYGHQRGDEALMIVARLMREFFPDNFTVRLGGDEFLICILGECSLYCLENKAQLLLHNIQRCFQAEQHLSGMSASIGIALTTDPEVKIDELIKQSDAAMYEAKQSGKSQYRVYKPEAAETVGKGMPAVGASSVKDPPAV